jgi:tetratricopeptide (TPR) repeat protein
MSVRVRLAALVALLAVPALAPAQPPALDPELTTPYRWQIVIDARPHPLLSAAFRDQLRRDLVAALQPDLGPLGTVEVVDLAAVPEGQRDPVWQDYLTKGFSALDAARDLTGVKTHFLRVEVRDGAYHLEARQYDGFAGLASPVVRRQSTRTPELVGRTAGLMIDRDLGVEGTLDPAPANATEVTVRFRAGKLGPLDRLVKPGDVFALARIARAGNRAAPPPVRSATGKIIAPPPGSTPPAALTPAVHSYTLLKVVEPPRDGAAKCAVLRAPKYRDTLPTGPGVVGYRCMKLHTVAAPVAVRLVGIDGTAATIPLANVRATEAGFAAPPDPKDLLDFRDGLYRSGRPVTNIACVTVTLGKTKTEQFPVPVLGPEPIALPFEVDPKAEAKAVFERSVTSVVTRVADARIAQNLTFEEVGKIIKARKNKEAADRAKAGFAAADTADKVLAEEIQQLRAQAPSVPGGELFVPLLTRGDEQLGTLRKANEQLARIILELDKVVAKASDPTNVGREAQAQSVNARINLLLAGGEVEEALAAYDQLATLLPDDPTVKERKAKLAAEWKPKDAEHEKARTYMLKTWPALGSVADLKESLPQLRAAVETCKKANDRHAFRRLLGVLGGFPSKLTDLIKDLDGGSDTDRKTLADAKTVRDVVANLEKDVSEFLKKGE